MACFIDVEKTVTPAFELINFSRSLYRPILLFPVFILSANLHSWSYHSLSPQVLWKNQSLPCEFAFAKDTGTVTEPMLLDSLNRLVSDTTSPLHTERGNSLPLVDVCETADALGVHAELPGIEKKDVKVDVTGGVLSISGERHYVKR